MTDLSGLGFNSGGSSAAGTYTYPPAAYLESKGVPAKIAQEIGGKPIPTPPVGSSGVATTKLGEYIPEIIAQFSKPKYGDVNKQAQTFGAVMNALFGPAGLDFATQYIDKGTVNNKFITDVNNLGKQVLASGGFQNVNYQTYQFNALPPSQQQAAQVEQLASGFATYANENATTAQRTSAYQSVADTLTSWGLGSLAPMVSDMAMKQGVSAQGIMAAIQQTQAYKDRFAGMVEYNKTHDKPITPAEYLSAANQIQQIADIYLPKGFVNDKEIGQLIAGGVGPKQFQDRIQNGYNVAANADPNVQKALAAQGVDMKHLAAYYLDPTKATPVLEQLTTKASLQGYAADIGLQGLSDQVAGNLAQYAKSQTLNPDGTFSLDAARRALEYANQNVGLTSNTSQPNAPTVSTAQLVGSQIAGANTGSTQAADQLAVARAGEALASPFEKGGGFAESAKGVTGIGAAKD